MYRYARTTSALLVLICIGLPVEGESDSPTEIKMTIEADTVFSTHLIVPENATLTILPGVKIEFTSYSKFLVKGLLIARGNPKEPIRITCPERPYGSEAAPCWEGLVIHGKKAHASLSNVRIEGAYRNLVWEAQPLFEWCEFVGNHYGLYCMKGAAPHVKKCRFYRNVYGVVSDYSTPMLADNVITDNTVGLCLQLSTRLVAGKNTIEENETDVKTEQSLGHTEKSLSLQYLWDLMQEIY